MMKKFELPEIEVVVISVEDVITSSNDVSGEIFD